MRQHNKYLDKVFEEMSVFKQHLLLGNELTTTQQATFDKITIARAWLKEGNSDSEVIELLRNDPATKIMDRRAREILSMAYEIFAELRLGRNQDGLKFLYEESYREAAGLVLKEANMAFRAKNRAEGGILMGIYGKLMKEAGIIANVYKESNNTDAKKKPTKIILQRKTVMNTQNEIMQDEITEEAHFDGN